MSSSPYRPAYVGTRAARPALPQKKGLAVASLVLGIIGVPTLGILLVGATVGLVLGIVALARANREPQIYGGKGLAIGGIITNVAAITVMPFFLGIIAAIAIPSYLRARVSANEAAAIGDVRAVISAEHAYAGVNRGFFDSLECLGTPQRCLPEYPTQGPRFLDESLAAATVRNGYDRTFRPGPPAEVDRDTAARISPSSVRSFAYVAVPTRQGTTGVRMFCGDSTGRVCALLGGAAPEVEGGLCARSCPDLR